jgi:ubiquitin thioesterase ZRANB1
MASPSQERQLSPLSVNVNIAEGSHKAAARKPSPTSPESAKQINNGKNRIVAGKQCKWTCKSCTYDNWPKSQKCVICAATKPKLFELGATGGHSPQIISPDDDKNSNKRGSTQSLSSPSSAHIDSIEQLAGATASPKVHEENNRVGDRKLKQIRNRMRESDWLWLNACQGIVDGDVRAVEAYLSSEGDTSRQLSQEEVIVLNRPSAFERGYTLVHIAVRFQREDILALLLTQTEAPCKAVKRVPSHISPDLAAEVRRDVATSVRQRKGDFPCYFLTECVTFALPAGE